MSSAAAVLARCGGEGRTPNDEGRNESLLTRIERVVSERKNETFCNWMNSSGSVSDRLSFLELWQKAGTIAFKLRRGMKVEKGQRAILLYSPGHPRYGLTFSAHSWGVCGLLLWRYCNPRAVLCVMSGPDETRPGLQKLQKIARQTEAVVVLCDSSIRKLHAVDSINPFSSTRSLWGSIPFVTTSSLSKSEQFTASGGQFSSGSTSEPKGVMISFGGLAHNVRHIHLAYVKRLGLGEDFHARERERGLSWLPHYHDMGLVVGLIRPLAYGCLMTYFSPLVFIQKPHLWIRALSLTKAHVSSTPNFGLRLAARKWDHDKHAGKTGIDLSSLVFIQCAAEPIQPRAVEAFIAHFSRYGLRSNCLAASYGLAESVVMVCADLSGTQMVSRQRPHLIRCGYDHHPDFDIRIVDPESCRELPENVEGEIWVSSPSTSHGYWKLSEQTAATFGARIEDGASPARGFLRTGDLGFFEDGGLFVSGRLKDLIIVRGQNLYPQDIESSAENASPMVRQGCVAAFAVVGEEEEEEELVVVLETRPECKTAVLNELCQAVAREVAGQCGLSPGRVVALKAKSIPKTTSGKIRRKQTAADLATGKLQSAPASNQVRHTLVVPVVARQQLLHAEAPNTVPEDAEQHEEEEGGGGHDEGRPRSPLSFTAQQVHVERAAGDGDGMEMDGMEEEVLQCVRSFEGLEAVDVDSRLMEHGLDSVGAAMLAQELEQRTGLRLDPMLFFECPTVKALATRLREMRHGHAAACSAGAPGLGSSWHRRAQPAIVGVAYRLPGGVNDVSSLARLLRAGARTSSAVPWERWDVHAVQEEVVREGRPAQVAEQMARGSFVGAGCVEAFDADYFGMTHLEAAVVDPQQRVLLQVAAEALLDAGYTREELGDHRIGVFVGCSGLSLFSTLDSAANASINSYLDYDSGPAALRGTRSALSAASGRISHTLGLQGPSLTVDTACSSSLVAMDIAKRYLLNGDCDAALVCSVNLVLSPAVSLAVAEAGMTSPDGECHTWDASACGYGRGEGCCAVVMRRFDSEEVPGDEEQHGVYAVVRGSAVGHDGESASLSAPNMNAQRQVIKQALMDGGVSAGEVQYLEAHGTGTPLGDPVEVGAAVSVYEHDRSPDSPLLVNSVKANLGHLEAAAGLAGVLAAISVLHTGEAHANAHLSTLNPRIASLAGCCSGAIHFPTAATPLSAPDQAIAGVSSFGFTGTLAHLLLQAPPHSLRRALNRPVRVAWLLTGQDQATIPPASLLGFETYRTALEECDRLVIAELGHSIKQIALARHWMEHGHTPEVIVGHSLGELAGLCVAGAMPLEVGVRLVCARARAVQANATARGCMVAVRATRTTVELALSAIGDSSVSIAAINGPEQVVLSGGHAGVDAVLARLPAGTAHKRLASEYAYHSPAMRAVLGGYQAAIRECLPAFHPPSIRVLSTVTGVDFDPSADPVTYLTEHLCGAVLFYDALLSALALGLANFVEIGPREQLGKTAISVAKSSQQQVWCHQGTLCAAKDLSRWAELLRQQQLPFQLQSFALNRLQHRLLQSTTRHDVQHIVWYHGWFHSGIQAAWLGQLSSPRPFLPSASLETVLAAAAKSNPDGECICITNISFRQVEIQSEQDRLQVCVEHGHILTMSITSGRDSTEAGSAEIQQSGAAAHSMRGEEERLAAALRSSSEWSEWGESEASCSVQSASKHPIVVQEVRGLVEESIASAIARLALPLQDDEEACGYLLHPLLLEAVMTLAGTASSRIVGGMQMHPMSVDSVEFVKRSGGDFRSPTEVSVYARAAQNDGQVRVLCTVADESGKILLTLNGIAMELGQTDVSNVIPGVVALEKVWVDLKAATPRTSPSALQLGQVLVVGDMVLPRDVMDAASEIHSVSTDDIPDVEALLGTSELSFDTIFVSCSSSGSDQGDGLLEATTVLKLVLRVLGLTFSRQTALLLLTHGCTVAGRHSEATSHHCEPESCALFTSMVSGAARAARAECGSTYSIVTIDADPVLRRPLAVTNALSEYFRCLASRSGKLTDGEYIHRNGSLLVGRYRPARHAAIPQQCVPHPVGGCYVVTGGTGRLGLMVARALVENGRARSIVLLSRSCREDPKGADDLAWLKRQEHLELEVMACDVGDERAVAETLQRVRLSGRSIKGVVHAAGVLRLGRVFSDEALAGVDDVLYAHVRGAWLLHIHTQTDSLDLFLVLSSVASALSVFGCSVYASAKAFQDELALFRTQLGLPGSSMQLPAIGGTGLADGLQLPDMFQSPAAQISEAACARLFLERLREKSGPTVELFLPLGLLAAMRKVLPPVCVVQFENIDEGASKKVPHPSALHIANPPPVLTIGESEPEEAVLKALQEVLAMPELTRDHRLLDVGVDSLTAAAVVDTLRAKGFTTWSIADVLSEHTIAELVHQKGFELHAGNERQGAAGANRPLLQVSRPSINPAAPGLIHSVGSGFAGLPIPASHQQEQMVVIQAGYPESCAYNEYIFFLVRRGFQVDAFEQAVRMLQNRYDALRTCFVQCDAPAPSSAGVLVVQLVAPETEARAPLLRMRASGPVAAGMMLCNAASQPFDVGRAPLFRVCVCQTTGSDLVSLALVFHHSIVDGWSVSLLLKDLAQCYASLLDHDSRLEGRDPTDVLPPVQTQYADYAVWQRTRLLTPERQVELVQYWQQALPRTPLLDLPTDRARPHMLGGAQGKCYLRVGRQLTLALREMSRRNGCTLFHTLLAAYALTLRGLSDADEVVVGVPCANRSAAAGLDAVVGDFVNTIPILVDTHGSVATLLTSVRDAVVRGMEHASLPFPRIASAAGAPRRLGRSTLVQTIFSLLAGGAHDMRKGLGFELTGATVEPLALEFDRDAKFELDMELTETEAGELTGHVGFMQILYEHATAARIAECYIRVLQRLCAGRSGDAVAAIAGDLHEQRQCLVSPVQDSIQPSSHRRMHASSLVAIAGHQTCDALRELCEREGCTLRDGLLAAYGLLILRTTNVSSVVIDVDATHRQNNNTLHASEQVLPSTLALVFEVRSDFSSLLHMVSQRMQALAEHSEISTADADKAGRGNVAVQAAFKLCEGGEHENAVHATPTDNWLSIEMWSAGGGDEDGDGELRGVVRGELGERVLRCGERYAALLDSIVATPSLDTLHLPILSLREQDEVARFTLDTPLMVSIPHRRAIDLFHASVSHSGGEVALVTPAERLSYSELDRRADQVAHALATQGVGAGHMVGLYVNRTAAMIVGMLGILKTGAAYVPLNAEHPAQRISQLVVDAALRALVLVQSPQTQWTSELNVSKVLVQKDGNVVKTQEHASQGLTAMTGHVFQTPAMPVQQQLRGSEVMYVYFTSGSTGRPKGVKLPHSAVLHYIYSSKANLKLQRSDRVLLGSCFTFDTFVGQMWSSIEAGASMALTPMGDMLQRMPEIVSELQCTWTCMTPTVLMTQSPVKLSQAGFKMVQTGGERVPAALVNSFCPHLRVLQMYGPTETAIWVTQLECAAKSLFPNCIGTPYPGLRLYVVDVETELLQPVGVPGELYVSGPQLALGYHNMPEETERVFRSNPFLRTDDTEETRETFSRMYKTGDLCQWMSDGSLEFLARVDREMKVQGVRIDPAEIEKLLLEVDGVQDAAVVLWEGKVYTAYVAAANTTSEACKAHLARVLPASMCPSVVMTIPSFPTSAAGKKDLKALPPPTVSSSRPRNAPVPVESEIVGSGASMGVSQGSWPELLRSMDGEARLQAIQVKLAAFAVDAGALEMEGSTKWMEAGLTSIGMIRLLSSLERELGDVAREPELGLRSSAVFFEFTTPEAMAQHIDAHLSHPRSANLTGPHSKPRDDVSCLPPTHAPNSQVRPVDGGARRRALSDKVKSLAEDAGALEMEGRTKWLEAGLTSLGMIRLLNSLKRDLRQQIGEEDLHLKSTALFFEFPTLESLVEHIDSIIESGASPDRTPVPQVHAHSESVVVGVKGDASRSTSANLAPPNHDGGLPAFWTRILRQVVVVLVVLSIILGATVPSIVMVERHFDSDSNWWLRKGRAGPLLMAVVPVWMCSYTVLCIIAKWVLIGRYTSNYCVMWGNAFMRWMIVERLWCCWDYFVGRFLVTTPWLNLVYMALGARVAWSARLDTVIKEWDLISIGKNAKVKGKLYGRIFDRNGVQFGTVSVGDHSSIGVMAVVQPASMIEHNVEVEVSCLVLPGSTLGPGGSWHGSPCRQRSSADSEGDGHRAAESAEPLFFTRLLFPLLFLASVVPIVTTASHLLPSAELAQSDAAWTVASVRRTLLYVGLYFCTGISMFAFTVVLKWSFVSPYVTDTMSELVLTTFFPFLEKTLFITWWHRAFGMTIGSNSIVTLHDFCRPSAAHLVRIGQRSVIPRSTANPCDPPTVWSWLRGRTSHPWGSRADIVIGDDVMVYLFARLESGVILHDKTQCTPNARLTRGTELPAGATAVGDPCMVFQAPPSETTSESEGIRMPRELIGLHYVTLALHVAACGGIVVAGLECMQALEVTAERRAAGVVLRVAFFVGWLLLGVGIEVWAVKWLGTGRARVGERSIYARTDYLFTHHMDPIQKVFWALFGGLFVMDMLLFSLGFKIKVGRVFINSPAFIVQDADVVTIEEGAVADEFAFILGHASVRDKLVVAECRIGAGAVLHPFSGLVMGTMLPNSTLFPRSRCFGKEVIGSGESWVGCPAHPM